MICWILLLCAVAPAQTSPATRVSSTVPEAADFSTPSATLTTVYTALRAGDIGAAHACLLLQDAKQGVLFDVIYTPLYGPFKLMHAMETRFGAAGRLPFANVALEKSLGALLEKIPREEIRIDGATAVVGEKKAGINPSAESELTGITLKNEGDAAHPRWKIVASTFGEATSDLPPSQLTMMRNLSHAVEAACAATGERLERGDFRSADEAYADYQARVQTGLRAAAAAPTMQRNP